MKTKLITILISTLLLTACAQTATDSKYKNPLQDKDASSPRSTSDYSNPVPQ